MKKHMTRLALMVASLLVTSASADQPVDGFAQAFGHFGPPQGALPPIVPPLYKQHGADPGQVPVLMMEKLDNAALAAASDAAWTKGTPYKIGVARPFVLDGSMGKWIDAADGGRLWTMEIASPGAVGMRVQFTGMRLPDGAAVSAYPVHDFTQMGGPFTGMGEFGTGEQYTPCLFEDRVRVEYYAPPGLDNGRLPFDIELIQHLFRDPIKDGFGGITPAEGTCHNDVTCSTSWANTARAVGRMTFSDGAGSYLCTGQLIATQTNDGQPLFITARHCISTQAVATTLQVYWLYQTATCNSGSPPSLGSLQTTSGSTLLATRTNADATLLRLTGTVPGGLFYVGWTTTPVTAGAAITGIHHPTGAYKRISFGTATDQTGCTLGTSAETVRADWTTPGGGVTEGGSSGSGIYLNTTQQLIATLSCGTSACGAPNSAQNDGYGRFASFYPDISTHLAGAAPSDDTLEENDSCAAARSMSVTAGTPLVNSNLIVKNTDEDWYSYTVTNGSTITVSLAFTNSGGNIDATLYTTCGGAIINGSTSTTNAESVTYTNNSGATQTARVRVYLASGTQNTYTMTSTLNGTAPTDDALEQNDTCTTARAMSVVTGTPLVNNGLIVYSGDEDWYSVTVLPGYTLVSLLTFTNANGNVDEQLFTTCGGTVVTSSTSTINGSETMTYNNTSGTSQTARIRVFLSGASASNTYNMTLTLTAPPNNDFCGNGFGVASGGTYNGTTVGMTVDGAVNGCGIATQRADVWYTYTNSTTGLLRLKVDTCSSVTDTVLSLYSGCPGNATTQVTCSDDAATGVGPCGSNSNTTSYVEGDVAPSSSMKIRVAMYGATAGTFVMHVNTATVGLPNDTCAGATSITPGSYAFDTTAALNDGPDETACNFIGFSGIARDIWYKWTAPSGGDLTVDTCGSTFDTKLAIYGECPTTGTPLVCDDDAVPACASGTLHSRVSLTGVTSGHTYFFRVGGYRSGTTDRFGPGTLNLAFTPVTPPCTADLGIQGGTAGQDGILDNNDFVVFINLFFANNMGADFGIQGGIPGQDGILDNNDFIVFINEFFAGCP